MTYGCFDGSIPYPESTFAPFTTMAGSSANEPRAPIPPAPRPESPATSVPVDANRVMGFETQPVIDAGLARGLKITKLQAGGIAEKAGLELGDVIRSTNGYLTEEPGNLTWILQNAIRSDVITLNILTAKTGEVRIVTIRRP